MRWSGRVEVVGEGDGKLVGVGWVRGERAEARFRDRTLVMAECVRVEGYPCRMK